MQSHSTFQTRFPPAWLWLVDEAIPSWVKSHYSPKASWKDKPFGPPDAEFFFKGIKELSELFTEDRPKHMPHYLNHPRYRSSYLLYFVPLQAAKFHTVFQLHPGAMDAAIKHAQQTGVLRVADLGAGPGTASIGLLLWLLDQKNKPESQFKIEFEWFDMNRSIMEDGKSIVEMISSHFPRLRDRVSVKIHAGPWSNAGHLIQGETSLILVGHVLNEAARGELGPSSDEHAPVDRSSPVKALGRLFPKMKGGGVLIVEPAERRSSQMVSQIRDQIIEDELVPAEGSSIWGPCLHAGRCPLASGRDWCHFSIPAEIPGKWFRTFSKNLSSGTEKQWVKFSYVWFASPDYPSKPAAAHLRRVISDPLKKPGLPNSILLCEQDRPRRLEIPPVTHLKRGDIINVLQVNNTSIKSRAKGEEDDELFGRAMARKKRGKFPPKYPANPDHAFESDSSRKSFSEARGYKTRGPRSSKKKK